MRSVKFWFYRFATPDWWDGVMTWEQFRAQIRSTDDHPDGGYDFENLLACISKGAKSAVGWTGGAIEAPRVFGIPNPAQGCCEPCFLWSADGKTYLASIREIEIPNATPYPRVLDLDLPALPR